MKYLPYELCSGTLVNQLNPPTSEIFKKILTFRRATNIVCGSRISETPACALAEAIGTLRANSRSIILQFPPYPIGLVVLLPQNLLLIQL